MITLKQYEKYKTINDEWDSIKSTNKNCFRKNEGNFIVLCGINVTGSYYDSKGNYLGLLENIKLPIDSNLIKHIMDQIPNNYKSLKSEYENYQKLFNKALVDSFEKYEVQLNDEFYKLNNKLHRVGYYLFRIFICNNTDTVYKSYEVMPYEQNDKYITFKIVSYNNFYKNYFKNDCKLEMSYFNLSYEDIINKLDNKLNDNFLEFHTKQNKLQRLKL